MNATTARVTDATPQERRFARNLYGAHSNPDYPSDVANYAHTRGYRLACWWPITPSCLERLRTPTHRCTHRCIWRCRDESIRHGQWHDHVVWLRQGTGRHPERFAMLSQPYGTLDFAEMNDTVTDLGATWHVTGRAPYGFGAIALLIEGTAR